MRTILNLLKLQIDNKTDLLKTTTPAKMFRQIIKILIGLILFTVVAVIVELRIFSLGVRINPELLAVILLATQIISLFFATGHVINTLYLCKDNEMLICLPVTPNQLFISKIIFIYLQEIQANAIISIPLFFGIGLLGGVGASFYLSFALYLLILPIFPIILASFISIPVMFIIKFLKKHTILSIASILVLVATCLFGYILLISQFAESFNIASAQIETVRQINATISKIGEKVIIYYQLALAMAKFSNWYYIALFILLCAVLSMLTIAIIRPFYFKTAMSSIENTVKTVKKGKPFKKSNVFFSLIKKETLCIFRSPADVFEYFLFTLLMPFIVFSYDKLLMSITVTQAGVNMIAGSHVLVVAIMAMLSNIASASAVSRDGGNFYNTKIIPVDYYTQIFAKFTFNAIFTVGALLVTMIVSFFIYPAWQIILGTVAIIFASLGHIAFSIDMDIKNPTKSHQGNETLASNSTPKSIISGLIIGFIMGLIVILLSGLENAVIPYIILIVLSIIFAIYRIYTLILRINLAYDKIEM